MKCNSSSVTILHFFIINFLNHSEMNKKTLIELGKGIVVVALGVALHNAVAPVFKKTTVSAPASTEA